VRGLGHDFTTAIPGSFRDRAMKDFDSVSFPFRPGDRALPTVYDEPKAKNNGQAGWTPRMSAPEGAADFGRAAAMGERRRPIVGRS
jgi:hypothetical protein